MHAQNTQKIPGKSTYPTYNLLILNEYCIYFLLRYNVCHGDRTETRRHDASCDTRSDVTCEAQPGVDAGCIRDERVDDAHDTRWPRVSSSRRSWLTELNGVADNDAVPRTGGFINARGVGRGMTRDTGHVVKHACRPPKGQHGEMDANVGRDAVSHNDAARSDSNQAGRIQFADTRGRHVSTWGAAHRSGKNKIKTAWQLADSETTSWDVVLRVSRARSRDATHSAYIMCALCAAVELQFQNIIME